MGTRNKAREVSRLSKEPMISVIMPVFNRQDFVGTAIESILAQTYTDFEFIIFDDGSTDDSLKIIQSYRDPRIRVVSGKGNRKLVPPLNDAIKMARGRYLARMDSDDISLPRRFEYQINFLEKHPDIDVCGGFFRTLGGGFNFVQTYPIKHDDIKLALMFFCAFANPTTMVRRTAILQKAIFYDEDFLYAEDYDFWSRMSASGCTFYNIPEVLLRYRVGHLHIFTEHGGRQQQLTHQIVARNLVDFGLPEQTVQPLLRDTYTLETLKEAIRIFEMLPDVNRRRNVYSSKAFDDMISLAKLRFVAEQSKLGIGVLSCIKKRDVFCQPKAFTKLLAKVLLAYVR